MKSIPVQQSERAMILDVLRGFALLGVLCDNIVGFSGWGFFSQPQREALVTWPSDAALGLFELAFIKGKFYSLFSLLFGIGFSIILVRNEQRGANPLRVFYRRLMVLFFIGAAHLYFLWEGDILMLYALLGLLLPLFRKCSDRTLLIWAAVLIASPILIDVIKVLLNVRTGSFLQAIGQNIDQKNGLPNDDDSVSQYLYSKNAGWKEWRYWQEPGFFYRYAYLVETNRLPKVLGMFLIGFYAGRKMIYANLENYISLFKKIRKWGFIIGIPANLAVAYFEIDEKSIPNVAGLPDTFFYAIGVVPLSLAYVSSICLFWIKSKGNNKLKILAPVGRMALTNYLMQTILCITLFYGVGFGLGGNIGPTIYYPIALGIYCLQILYSNWWFRYFNYGPFEWLWRSLTYWKKLPMIKTNDEDPVAEQASESQPFSPTG
jgi:uncharacterized protein